MSILADFLLLCLHVYFYVIVISVIVSWLVAFEVINAQNEKAKNLLALLNKATEPVYRPLRKFIPSIGGIDVTPIVVIFGIFLLERIIIRLLY